MEQKERSSLSKQVFPVNPSQVQILPQLWKMQPSILADRMAMAILAIHEELDQAGRIESFSVEEAEILLKASEEEYVKTRAEIEESLSPPRP